MSFLPAYRAANPGLWGRSEPDAEAWATAVVSNGGTVSDGRLNLVKALAAELKAGGSWQRQDDSWIWCSENAAQALTSLKQGRLATAVNSPALTANGLQSDGSTSYVNTNFVPSTHAVVMTGSDMRLASYQRSSAVDLYSIGTLDTATRGARFIPRLSGDATTVVLNHTTAVYASGVTDNRGMTVVSRTGAGACEAYKNGVSLGTNTPTGLTTTLPTRALYCAAQNNVGTAAGFFSGTLGMCSIGASLTAAQELADYNAWQRFFIAIGKNV